MALSIEDLPLGKQLRVLRVARGMAQWVVAARAGMNPARVSEIETGRRLGTPAEWNRLRSALDASSDSETRNSIEQPQACS